MKASMLGGTNPVSHLTTANNVVWGQNFNRSEPSLKDIVRDQLRINSEVGKKSFANDRILESIDSMMNNFTVAVQNQLNFNKVLGMWIAQLATCHTPFREIGNEASIRVPRMFKSHAWQQYDKQMQCY
jgi:hypothetical protein